MEKDRGIPSVVQVAHRVGDTPHGGIEFGGGGCANNVMLLLIVLCSQNSSQIRTLFGSKAPRGSCDEYEFPLRLWETITKNIYLNIFLTSLRIY